LCGDSLTLWVKVAGDRIADVSFKGQGCAISKASASLMTAAVKGKSRAEAEELFERFHRLVTGKMPEAEHASMGSLRALGGVSRFPLRVKCASLAWHALHSALSADADTVSTEREGPEAPPGEGA
jgi:nitrogen fixation NifU-like protein